MLSRGFGFAEFSSKEDAIQAVKLLQNQTLDGHSLSLKLSKINKKPKDESSRKGTEHSKASTKVVIRNLPFEATKKELRLLFKPFGQLKAVRIPKKFDGSSRGFGFVEFTTKQEAVNALESLKHSHFYGRHLVLEYSKESDSSEANEEQTRDFYHE